MLFATFENLVDIIGVLVLEYKYYGSKKKNGQRKKSCGKIA